MTMKQDFIHYSYYWLFAPNYNFLPLYSIIYTRCLGHVSSYRSHLCPISEQHIIMHFYTKGFVTRRIIAWDLLFFTNSKWQCFQTNGPQFNPLGGTPELYILTQRGPGPYLFRTKNLGRYLVPFGGGGNPPKLCPLALTAPHLEGGLQS